MRAFRAFFFLRAHKELFSLEVFSNYVVPRVDHDLFHHLSRRYYLAKNLNLKQRVDYIFSHYCFEEYFFDAEYKDAVYSEGGLVLWNKIVDGTDFQIRLTLGDRYAAEGDLCIALMVNEARLHAISFSWISKRPDQDLAPLIFIALNQGRWQKEHEFHDKFRAAFPYNSANFVCYAALQGLSKAVGARELRAVASELQVCFSSSETGHFENAYDGFWKSVGGMKDADSFILPVPWPLKQLSEISAKHRKRAGSRRVLLDAVAGQACRTVAKHFRSTL